MAKHGIEQHYVRPDRVYATGVLTPIVGYQPAEDAQQVAARFVSGGQGLQGVAGLRIAPLRGAMRGVDTVKIRGWFDTLMANIRARWEANKIRRELKQLAPGGTAEMDTSPRPPSPYPGAVPTQSGWSPVAQSPSSAAAVVTQGGVYDQQPAQLPEVAAGRQLAPDGTNLPMQFWQNAGLPPVVAARGSADVLTKFFANLAGGRRRR